MEHHTEPNGSILATIFFAVISFMFKGGVVGVDTYILLPLAHLVSIIAGTCATISFLFVLHPPLKDGLLRAVSFVVELVKRVFKK